MAAFWAAVAATFSAIASFLMVLMQRRNMLESVRPELVVMGWECCTEKDGDGYIDVIRLKKIRNVGRGVALNLRLLDSFELTNDEPVYGLASETLQILPVNEEWDVFGEILIFWQNVPTKSSISILPISFSIKCADSHGHQHVTRYGLFAHKNRAAADTAPRFFGEIRRTTRTSIWRLWFDGWVQRGREQGQAIVTRILRDRKNRQLVAKDENSQQGPVAAIRGTASPPASTSSPCPPTIAR